jgi:putative SOS response-associated peptidase YedK
MGFPMCVATRPTATRSGVRATQSLVRQYHPKAMPVILTTQDEIDTWMDAPAPIALKLQRPLPDNALMVVARGAKEDGGPQEPGPGMLL